MSQFGKRTLFGANVGRAEQQYKLREEKELKSSDDADAKSASQKSVAKIVAPSSSICATSKDEHLLSVVQIKERSKLAKRRKQSVSG